MNCPVCKESMRGLPFQDGNGRYWVGDYECPKHGRWRMGGRRGRRFTVDYAHPWCPWCGAPDMSNAEAMAEEPPRYVCWTCGTVVGVEGRELVMRWTPRLGGATIRVGGTVDAV